MLFYEECWKAGKARSGEDKPGCGGIVIPNPAQRVRNLLAERVFERKPATAGRSLVCTRDDRFAVSAEYFTAGRGVASYRTPRSGDWRARGVRVRSTSAKGREVEARLGRRRLGR